MFQRSLLCEHQILIYDDIAYFHICLLLPTNLSGCWNLSQFGLLLLYFWFLCNRLYTNIFGARNFSFSLYLPANKLTVRTVLSWFDWQHSWCSHAPLTKTYSHYFNHLWSNSGRRYWHYILRCSLLKLNDRNHFWKLSDLGLEQANANKGFH